ncbi:uncharacterized protein LOC109545297 [Dendroctonus ponderosae]|uniref:ZAD domain-containing protein n=1 Tax=Dendroctonus ponderosae TaxID=77166 RepID=A0AAR5QE01_DENPD|nr:uncharacterized protein LOC109545297 [Dendroctonus ponderosae]KAH1016880.1 hypothetical protein HUJ04_008041 [Dendroctonus ponderosae]KAH1026317.1 hypothetical protein HUJ05_010854 [Dendroctonus ponderosae]
MEDKQSKCFVPECNNNVGVLFPKNGEVRKSWLLALRLEHLTPDRKSFVCMDHFGENGQPFTRIKSPHPNHSSGDFASIPVRHTSKKVCRLCMTESSNVTERIFSKLDAKHTIAQAISICLHPLKVLPSDNLSKLVCVECRIFLKEYLSFHTNCIRMDLKQRQILLQQNNHPSITPHTDSDSSDTMYLYEERLSDYEKDKGSKEKVSKDNTNGQIVSKASNGLKPKTSQSNQTKKKSQTDNEELLKVLEGSEDPAPTGKSNPSVINSDDKIADGIESSNDLNEDNIGLASSEKEAEYIEDIIIELVDDDRDNAADQQEAQKKPVAIKCVESTKNHSVKRSIDTPGNNNSVSKKSRIDTEAGVEVANQFSSPLGQFPCKIFRYAFDSQFILSDEYLYEFRLTKGNVRQLRCILFDCPAFAEQYKDDSSEYLPSIEVVTPHNHRNLTTIAKKQQMFFAILYDKMMRDKYFNFRVLYDDFCKIDSTIQKFLPLRNVIGQICKQPPLRGTKSVPSFDELFNNIENDEFKMLHFNTKHVQFYQERLSTEDGGKALVFANQDVIKKYSHSNIMYVDSSFFIESEGFPFTLITVLLWVEPGCYYPILFSLVNMKSKDLYMKIFSFVHENLAPQLKPQEIISDYEANLYYALCIVYEESSIGGSMFYFIQNIYKKICSLNLARELELNANFRSIYNMILMLPLLPVNTILDGFSNIEFHARELDLDHLTSELFRHVRDEWIIKVTPEFFCVHRLENRINENMVGPFKKLRDLLMLTRSKSPKQKNRISAITTIEKLIELDTFLSETFQSPLKQTFGKDNSSNQKKAILRAWNYIEIHPMINIHQFFQKVLGYIKCMESQLWIWGLYRFAGSTDDGLINALNFSIVKDETESPELQEGEHDQEDTETEIIGNEPEENPREVAGEYYIDNEGIIREVEKQQITIDRKSSAKTQKPEQEIDVSQEELTGP